MLSLAWWFLIHWGAPGRRAHKLVTRVNRQIRVTSHILALGGTFPLTMLMMCSMGTFLLPPIASGENMPHIRPCDGGGAKSSGQTGAAGLGEGKIRPWAGKLFSDGRDHVKQEKIHPGAVLREIKETKKFTGERNFFLSLCVYIIRANLRVCRAGLKLFLNDSLRICNHSVIAYFRPRGI